MALASLRGVFDDGEPVDELDHALQAADLAQRAGADGELVLAALLHDIGRAPSVAAGAPNAPHELAAARWLAPRLGKRVAWLAGAHVAAKRFLVATDPAYAAALSATSIRSLDAQGGAALDAALVGHPWWSDALTLRRFDDAAKVPGARTPSLEAGRALTRRGERRSTPARRDPPGE